MPVVQQKKLLFVAMLMAALLLLVAFNLFSRTITEQKISNHLLSYLLNIFEEPMFSSVRGVVNDEITITDTGKQINAVMTDLIANKWYSGIRSCQVVLYSVDGVQIQNRGDELGFKILNFPRNKIERLVEYEIQCSSSYPVYLIWFGVFVGVFFVIYRLIAFPLTPLQSVWLEKLVEMGSERKRAEAYCASHNLQGLLITQQRNELVEVLYVWEKRFDQLFRYLHDPRLNALSENQLKWLGFSLAHVGGDVEAALKLVNHPNTVRIDLLETRLSIHGVNIDIKKTPLFYFAWYASKKQAGQGWVTNPQSNVPNHAAGAELAKLMANHHGHAKAIDDLLEAGLKSKTLDQNRSKIKESIESVLGEALAEPYLFEMKKDLNNNRMSYQLGIDPAGIEIIE